MIKKVNFCFLKLGIKTLVYHFLTKDLRMFEKSDNGGILTHNITVEKG